MIVDSLIFLAKSLPFCPFSVTLWYFCRTPFDVFFNLKNDPTLTSKMYPPVPILP
jgi:hypothetical protein